jgi:hypothetical protein
MDRPRLIRGLRLAWSVWWGILCVLLIVLWVRSYFHPIELYSKVADEWYLSCYSFPGWWRLEAHQDSNNRHSIGYWEVTETPADEDAYKLLRWKFRFELFRYSVYMGSPYWFVVASSAILGVVSWLPWSFSLRTLLIATTLIAVVLGLVAWSSS